MRQSRARRATKRAGLPRLTSVIAVAVLATIATACSNSAPAAKAEYVSGGATGHYYVEAGIHKIKHVIVIMQENRSFDSYFGTYPGADGIPMHDGVPTVCVPDTLHHSCDKPFHDTMDRNGGGPHAEKNAIADVNGGKMNGFVAEVLAAKSTCRGATNPACTFAAGTSSAEPDVMGYHTAAELPNYWTYAKDFVLDDHMFEPVKSWSLPDHLYMVSAWSAKCLTKAASSCVNNIAGPYAGSTFNQAVTQELAKGTTSIDLAWTDETWLLYHHHVSWRYYIQTGQQPDCSDDAAETCAPVPQSFTTPGIWNPLPLFTDVQADQQEKNIRPLDDYFADAKKGTLPAVSWVTPSEADSEHPPSSIHRGQAYVTAVVNAAMKTPDWSSTAIFLAWDDWGGFYDNLVPPQVDKNGYGLRVPALVISPYAKKGFIDHEVLSSDAYLKFIEDDFLGGARLDPATDGRPDPRPDVRENMPQLGNLANDFDFSQTPRPPVLLPTNPPSDSPDLPPVYVGTKACFGCTYVQTPQGVTPINPG